MASFDLSQADPGVGPIYVEQAEPGDVLRIDFLTIEPSADFGWTAIFPGFGLLSEDNEFLFSSASTSQNAETKKRGDGVLKLFDLGAAGQEDWVVDRGYVVFRKGTKDEEGKGRTEEIRIPYRPFLGLVGVAPAEGEHPMVPPLETGGNIDTRWLGVGSSLYLPVKVPGALLSLGDGHAAQGDGEICGTAIETRMRATILVTVEKGKSWIKSPWVLTPKQGNVNAKDVKTETGATGNGENREFMCLGVDSDLREATKKAVRGVIDWLEAEKGLIRTEAYMLASVAGMLRMCEVVDMPNYAIGCAIPLNIFVPLES
jgi:acetamidase/formamidase